MREIRYASLLHDFGKVGVREEVLVKAKKLYPAQLEVIKQRFGFVRRTLENEVLSCHGLPVENGHEKFLAAQKDFDARLDDQLAIWMSTRRPSSGPTNPRCFLRAILTSCWKLPTSTMTDLDGNKRPFLNQEEVQMLSIRKGSLDDEERLQIESHVLHTVSFLQADPLDQ